MQPLEGIKVLDFSTLLPGPMCTLLLAEAGADVTKVERLDGDEMRSYVPKFENSSVNFALLNRGKKSICVDLKSAEQRALIEQLIADTDVLVEQFRPGVMQRLGLDYQTVSRLNPKLIYCSITGYGQTGPKALTAAHDLNYQAETGMLALSCDSNGAPSIPPVLTADLAAGTYPAVMNILLALRQRDRDGQGRHLDIAMADNLFPLMYWALGNGWSEGQWPRPGAELVTGGTPRYRIYRTQDDRYIAAAPLEEKFWRKFLELIDAPELLEQQDIEVVGSGVARAIAAHPAAYWTERFANQDICAVQVVNLEDAVQDPHFISRGLFSHSIVGQGGQTIPALPVPICPDFRHSNKSLPAPELGQDNASVLGAKGKSQ